MQYDELKEHIKQAMKAHDKVRLSILRQVHGEIKNIEVNERRDITEQDVDDMTKRVIKQTKETLEGSIKAGNNQERTDMLTAQVKMLEELLPQQLAGEQLSALIDAVLSETGATTKKEMGRAWVSSPSAPAATSTRPLPRRSCKASLPNEAPVSE